MPKQWSIRVLACLIFVLASLTAGAQVITGTIHGQVVDESKASMPGVNVTVKNVDTGVTHTAVTDGEGRYLINNLSVGSYRVEAELSGFKTGVRTGITLTVGQDSTVDFTLGVGNLTETVEVSTAAPLVETSKSQLADLVDQRQMAELPLNSRSYTDLALIEPGVTTQNRNGGNFGGLTGGGIGLSISGARPTNTAFYVDGMDSKDAFGRTPSSAAGTTLGVDTMREFQVLTSNFSAQFGGSGGVLNAVTKSGTNQFHGDGFYFVRDSKFDALNPYDRANLGIPPFHRDQPGFTIGGPIKKDKTFFFFSYEYLNSDKTTTTILNTPAQAIRDGNIPGQAHINVDPLSAKIMAQMPLPNGIINSNGIGEYSTFIHKTDTENYLMAKIDQQVSAKDNFFVRFTSDVADDSTPLAFPGFFVTATTKNRFLIGEYDRIISPSLLNTARFAVNNSTVNMANTSSGIDTSTFLVPGAQSAQQMVIPGISSWGNRGFDDRAWYLTSLQASERLSYTKGKQALVGGMDIIHTSLQGYSASRLDGRVTFSSLANFLSGKPAIWEYLVPGTGSNPTSRDQQRTFDQNQFAFYVQDDIKPRSNLTINAGVRWEFVDHVSEANGQISNLLSPSDPTTTVGAFFNPKKANFGPRLGFAWDPKGDGKTSVRGAYGLFYQPMNYAVWQIVAVQNAPYFQRAEFDNSSWPPPYSASTNGAAGTPSPIQTNPNTPYYQQYNVTLQRQLGSSSTVALTYAGSKGRNLASSENGNPYQFTTLADGTKFWGTTGAQIRVNPNFGVQEYRNFDLISNYDSLQGRASKRFGSGLQLQASYTFSRNFDDGSETQGTAVMDPSNPLLDYGLSANAVTHNLTINGIYQLPFFADRKDVMGYVLGGWQVSAIWTLQSGLPVNVIEGFNYSRDGNVMSVSQNNDRPSLVPGADQNPINGDGRNPLAYANVTSFTLQAAGTHGNLGRNTLIGPGLNNVDASFVKNLNFGQGRRIELRVEFFNVLNRVNYSAPNNSAFVSTAGPNPSFGRITSTSTPSRQFQGGLKIYF